MAKSVSLVKNEENTPVQTVEDDIYDAYSGAGSENVKARDLIIPRLTILQGLSPQVNKLKAEYIKGAETGEFCDVSLNKTFGPEIEFIPVYYQTRWMEWFPRDSGKGLARIHDNDAVMNEIEPPGPGEDYSNTLPNGNFVMETAHFYGLNLTADLRRCFMPLQSTQLKKKRRWLSMINDLKLPSGKMAPMFFGVYKLGSVGEQNNKGDFYGIKVEFLRTIKGHPREAEIFQTSKEFLESIRTGAARADDSSLQTVQSEEGVF